MIKKLFFENFKGFAKAEMAVESLTTLIGANASGKSNAIEGLKILSELMTGRELSTILDGSKNMDSGIRGGSKGCCRFRQSSFRLGCLIGYDERFDLKYMIEIEVSDRVMVQEESLYEITKKDGSEQFLFCSKQPSKESGEIEVTWNHVSRGSNPDIMCIRLSSAISQIVTKVPQDSDPGKKVAACARKVIEDLKNILFLDPEPSSMRNYARINDTELKVNASNLSAVLNKLCKQKEIKNALLDMMRQLPENEITDISFAEGSLNDVILFLTESYGSHADKIDATRLSDGTLRCLAILAALWSENEGGMLVIEEIDNGIHSGRATQLVETISAVARQRNLDVLITTHNATVLNALSKEDLQGVDVVYRETETGASAFISLIDIDKMPQLLAQGKLGDVVTNGLLLEFIKKPKKVVDYSWLGV